MIVMVILIVCVVGFVSRRGGVVHPMNVIRAPSYNTPKCPVGYRMDSYGRCKLVYGAPKVGAIYFGPRQPYSTE